MKKIIAKILFLFAGAMLFAQSAEYTAFLAKAKQFETQKKWCHALESYYDAMGTDDEPALKDEAYKGFTELKSAILSGNPGLGKFNPFTLHDEWKNLLIDAEQVGSSFNGYEITLGELKQGDLDYVTRTASYLAEISYKVSDRYENTIGIVEKGYGKAYKDDWSDLSRYWPGGQSVSYKNDRNYNVAGAFVYGDECVEYNAFVTGLFDYKFNIVDENGKELVKGVKWLFKSQDSSVIFKGISPAIMDLIDNGKAFVNPLACYLEYGRGGKDSVQLPMEKSVFICWNNKSDRKKEIIENLSRFKELEQKRKNIDNLSITFANIPEQNYKVLTTEVTQELYERVMGENPSKSKGEYNPVERVSWYDAIYFCNELSIIKNLQPVYSVNGETDVTKWNYIPHKGRSISTIVSQNIAANGFRLPTLKEWQYAAEGGESYEYAGNANLDEVGWYTKNSDKKTHLVGQKKANAYGLYDMSGNVWEWVWDSYSYDHRYYCGGCCISYANRCNVGGQDQDYAHIRDYYIGFRLVCTSSSLQ